MKLILLITFVLLATGGSSLYANEVQSTIGSSTASLPEETSWIRDVYSEYYRSPLDRESHWFLRIQALRFANLGDRQESVRLGAEVYPDNSAAAEAGRKVSAVSLEWHHSFAIPLTTVVGGRSIFQANEKPINKLRLGLYGGTFSQAQEPFASVARDSEFQPFFESYYEAFAQYPLNGVPSFAEGASKSQSVADSYFSLSLKTGWRYQSVTLSRDWLVDPILLEARLFQNLDGKGGQEVLNVGPRFKWSQAFSRGSAKRGQSLAASVFLARSFGWTTESDSLTFTEAANADPFWFLFTLGGAF